MALSTLLIARLMRVQRQAAPGSRQHAEATVAIQLAMDYARTGDEAELALAAASITLPARRG